MCVHVCLCWGVGRGGGWGVMSGAYPGKSVVRVLTSLWLSCAEGVRDSLGHQTATSASVHRSLYHMGTQSCLVSVCTCSKHNIGPCWGTTCALVWDKQKGLGKRFTGYWHWFLYCHHRSEAEGPHFSRRAAAGGSSCMTLVTCSNFDLMDSIVNTTFILLCYT